MKIPRLGLRLLKVIAEHSGRVTNRHIAALLGISVGRVQERVAAYRRAGFITQAGGQINRVITITDAGYQWAAAGQERLEFFEKHGRLPKMPGSDTGDTQQRKCLGPDCGKEFRSEWKGNRICKDCRDLSGWRSGSHCEAYSMGRRI